MFSDYDTPGSDLSGAPASVAAAHASESDAHASAEPSSGSDLEALGQESKATPEGDTSSVANGSANTGDLKGPRDSASVSQTSTIEISVPAEEATSPSSEELNQLMDQYAVPQQAPTEGEIVEGRVVAIADVGAVVDIGGKTEALIPAGEFMEADQPIRLDPGQNIEVQLTGEHKDGYLVVSYQRARRRRVWANLDKAYHDKSMLTGRIVDRVKGGLVVDVGVRAFLPASQVDLRPVHELEEWKDRDIEIRVLKLNRKRGNVVVSRRAVLEDEQKLQRQKLLESITEGQIFHGTVKSITSYGVFVDIGGVDGLLHVSDLSWGRVANPVDVVRPGDELDVQVLKFDREKMRVSLGRRQLLPDPWATVPERFPVNARVQGRVVGVADYGAFVELDSGVEGLVHVSEMSWSKRKQHPSKLVQVGDAVEVVVLELHPEQRRISLGMKQARPDPWVELAQKYPVGSQITGKVRNLTDFGAFVEIEEGFDGLIHVSDISWTGKIKDPAEALKKGDTVQAKVLKIDPVHRRVSLGIKQLNDIWANWFAAHKLNEVVRGRVSRLTTFGAFVELADGIEGLCHISEIEDRRGREKEKKPQQGASVSVLAPGREYDFKIVKINPDQHKIGLSYRAAVRHAERREMEDYRSSKSSPTATIGDALLAKRESL
ncbi:MAG: 30S ribosomal protein S1 [Acidobacteria bacterium]|nr:MAG: 30S ribosomal protein S1 [Acidobacteriota bacterium]